MTGVSIRTLHYYDEIGLLKPSHTGSNRYRYYDNHALLRLQQILFYREMDLELKQIKTILDDEQFDLVKTLQSHRKKIQAKIERMSTLIQTIDETILYVTGEHNMNKKKLFSGFTPAEEKRYEEEAFRLWGENARESNRLWNNYNDNEKTEIMKEGNQIYLSVVDHMGKGPESIEIQSLMKQWHNHLRHFYEPTHEIMRGLSELYCEHPDFKRTFQEIHPDLPHFLKQAITYYIDNL